MSERECVADLRSRPKGHSVDNTFLVLDKVSRLTKAGKPFLSLKLGDSSGSISGKLWNNVEAIEGRFAEEDYIHLRGHVNEFSGTKEINIQTLQKVPESKVDMREFVAHTERDPDEMYDEVLQAIAGFKNEHLRRLLRSIFGSEQFATAYKKAPAAKMMHHARVGGLLEHVSSLMDLARAVASHYDDLDEDLLLTGVLLHDLGKIGELKADRTFGYTDRGKLLGHIYIGTAWIDQRCDKIEGFPPRLKNVVLHLVLGHHGKKEFGSPVLPAFPEALALHYIDDLDSKLEIMRSAINAQTNEDAWTPDQVYGLQRYVLDKTGYLEAEPDPSPTAAAPPATAPPTEPAPPTAEPVNVVAAAPEEPPLPVEPPPRYDEFASDEDLEPEEVETAEASPVDSQPAPTADEPEDDVREAEVEVAASEEPIAEESAAARMDSEDEAPVEEPVEATPETAAPEEPAAPPEPPPTPAKPAAPPLRPKPIRGPKFVETGSRTFSPAFSPPLPKPMPKPEPLADGSEPPVQEPLWLDYGDG